MDAVLAAAVPSVRDATADLLKSTSRDRLFDDSPTARRGYMRGIFGEHAILVTRLRRAPRLAACGKLLGRHVELNEALAAVERDAVAVLDERDSPADEGFRRDMANEPAP